MRNFTEIVAGILAACPIAAFAYIDDYRLAIVVSVSAVAIGGYLLFGYRRDKS